MVSPNAIGASVDHNHHEGHGERLGPDQHSGHSVAMFRNRFWVSLALTAPVIAWSQMPQEWFGYSAPRFPGSDLIAPLLGTVIFLYGGTPFLIGAIRELKARQPGMMLLIAMAIAVAFLASLATTLGAFDLEFWWELAALITIMLLGHWMEMRAVS
ncbi:MAG TPA: heavy metal translocating P-type ATPase, partial [Acidimicrobiia bacterium]